MAPDSSYSVLASTEAFNVSVYILSELGFSPAQALTHGERLASILMDARVKSAVQQIYCSNASHSNVPARCQTPPPAPIPDGWDPCDGCLTGILSPECPNCPQHRDPSWPPAPAHPDCHVDATVIPIPMGTARQTFISDFDVRR